MDAKIINTLADAFKLAHQSLFKLRMYEGYCTMRNIKCQKYNNKLTCTKTQVITAKINLQIETQPTRLIRHAPYMGTCWKCKKCGHVTKEYKSNPSKTKLTDKQEQTTTTYGNTHNNSPVSPIKSHTKILPTNHHS